MNRSLFISQCVRGVYFYYSYTVNIDGEKYSARDNHEPDKEIEGINVYPVGK
ncbi:MAG: hypothetical protein ABI477_06490 [Chryseolinea sp.]